MSTSSDAASALASAQSAAASAAAASTALGEAVDLVVTPNDSTVATLVNTPSSSTALALSATYATRQGVAVAASGAAGQGEVTQSINAQAPVPAITDPSDLAGLAVWLDASDLGLTNGDPVSTWTDKSGNGHHATQTSTARPTFTTAGLNGLPVLTFGGTQWMKIANYGPTPRTIFVVGRNNGTNSHRSFAGGISGDTDATIDAWYFKANGNPSVCAEFSAGDRRYPTDIMLAATIPAIIGSAYLQAGTFNRATKTLSLWNNGGRPQVATAQADPAAVLVQPGSEMAIGASYYSRAPGDMLSGFIAEFITYDRILTPAEMTAVGRYLDAKWGLTVEDFTLPDPITEPLIMTTFAYTSGAVAWKTYIAASHDGVNWRDINGGTPVLSGPPHLSDGAAAANGTPHRHTDGYWYVATTAYNSTPKFNIHRSKDLFTWEWWTVVDCSGVAGAAETWAPEWFTDTDGSLHIFLCIKASGSFKIYKTTPSDGTLKTWATPTVVTGTGFPAQMIDPFVLKRAGYYHLFYKNDTTGHTEIFTSTTIASGYTAFKTGPWLSTTVPQEGPCVFRVNGHWRLLVDVGGANALRYADSDDLTTWTALTPLVFDGTTGQIMRHGTVVDYS